MSATRLAETVVVTDTSGRLEVLGGDFDVALLLDGKPLALMWPDQQGSVAQYLIRSGGADLREEFQAARALIERGLLPNLPLIAAAGPFLTVVAPGEYELVFEPAADGDYFALDAASVLPMACEHFYPLYWDLFATLPTAQLDRSRVEYFREELALGNRPVVVALTAVGADCQFVIDGHHKLAAYREVRVAPPVLLLIRRNPPSVDPRALEGTFGEYSMWADYKSKKPWPR